MRPPLLLLYGLALGGCAWEPGQGFTVVQPTVRAAYETLPTREAADDYQRLSSDYQVRVDSAELELSDIELLASSGGAGGSFDPANPPPGYSLCHGGHCHRDDGALIPYEQIAAELGGGGGPRKVVTLPVGEPMNLLAPEVRTVGCTPDCELPRAEVSQGRWGLETLRIEGTVRDSRPTPRFPGERRFRLNLPQAGNSEAPVAVLAGPVDLPSDRVHPPRAKLALNLVLTAALFDPLDWVKLAVETEGVVDFDNPANAEAREALLERLAQVSPQAEVTRGDP
jgi:hypothetical protein